MKTYTLADIRGLEPCYDPIRFLPEDWAGTVLDILSHVEIPPDDKLWVVTHWLDDRTNRLFAVWCAREALKLVDDPDPRSVAACDVAERYTNGEATDEELKAAWAAAWDAARDAARASANAAAWSAANAAAWAAAWDAAWDAARDAARASANAAARASANAAAWSAAWDAARDAARASAWASSWDASWDAARSEQIERLKEMIQLERSEPCESNCAAGHKTVR